MTPVLLVLVIPLSSPPPAVWVTWSDGGAELLDRRADDPLAARMCAQKNDRHKIGPILVTPLQHLERSERPVRVGKTPAELLTGQSHCHWLEMLGYTRFHRA